MNNVENKRISIILPVYNSEKYLAACLDSILCQNYTDWELLIVDDGSTDSSASIIQTYAQKSNKIISLHQENRGVSCARNKGLENATGKYIVFIDADDLLPPFSLKIRYEEMQINSAELFLGSYQIFSDDPNILHPMPVLATELNLEAALNNITTVDKLGYQGYLWNKIFLHSIITENHIRFCEDVYYNEDRLFVTLYLLHCNAVRSADRDVYHYRKHTDSAMGQFTAMQDSNLEKILSEFKAFDLILAAVYPSHKQFYKSLSCKIVHRILMLKDQLSSDNTDAVSSAMSTLIIKYSFQTLGAHFSAVSFREQYWCLKQIAGELLGR